MNTNYYLKKMNILLENEFSFENSLIEICNIFLDKKPKKLNMQKQNQQFWNNTKLVENILKIKDKNLFSLVIARSLREGYYFDNDLIENIMNLDKEYFINAIKYSKIFLKHNNYNGLKNQDNYQRIKETYKMKNLNSTFFQACDLYYYKRKEFQLKLEKEEQFLFSLGYVDLLCLISLYMMKNLKANFDVVNYSINTEVISSLVKKRLEERDLKKRPYSFNELSVKIMKRCFLIDTKSVETLEKLISYKKEYFLFNEDIKTFCYDNNFSYKIEDSNIKLEVVDSSKYIKWQKDGEKINILFQYYHEEGMIGSKNLLENQIFGLKENDDINKFAYCSSLETSLLVSEIYGLPEKLNLTEDIEISLFNTILTINSLRGLYQKYFIYKYYKDLELGNNWEDSLKKMISDGMICEGKNRLPLINQNLWQFAENMGELDGLSFEKKKLIEKFWMYDLKDKSQKGNIFEKPLLKIDDQVLIMPYSLGLQSSSTQFINNLLRTYTERQKFRALEVRESENKLAQLFEKNSFSVCLDLEIDGAKDLDIGDIDMICEKDGYLFVLELKSTFIRTDFENIWNYKNRVLRKAGNQLKKRKFYIDKLLLNEEYNKLKVLKSKPKTVYYWIIDTSFEFDHELFDDFLKISMFELIYALNSENDEFYPNGFEIKRFISLVSENKVWKTILKL